MSENGIELTNGPWSRTLLWFDIECLAQEGTYQPENHYKAMINGKPLHEFRDMEAAELIAHRDWLATKALKEQLEHE